ncbi:MAG: PAS domain S-box protein [Candidatus Undinarchaeales archaeon]|jgi:PAS domain S-box-containing protein|nr:PAS domain S-box protein [Candidatus Undinarchaeales archaeon]MDP7492906.1 PAS domain S-box protein [Candidatus Undinarchaeales archaeon]
MAKGSTKKERNVKKGLSEEESRYRGLFEYSPISLWEEDFTALKSFFDDLQKKGVKDFRKYFEGHPEAVEKCAGIVNVIDVNKRTLDLYKAKSKKELLLGLPKVFGEESFPVFREEIIALAEGKTTFESEAVNKTLKGDRIGIRLSLAVAPGYEGTLFKVFVSILDITKRKRAEAALNRRLKVEETITGVSSRFVNVTDMDTAITATLADMGTLSGASRSYLFKLRDEQRMMDNTHEWCSKGVESQKENLQGLPSDMLPWWMSKLMKQELIHITDVSELPKEAAAEREILEEQDIKSLLVLPVLVGGELSGFLGFDNVEDIGEWSEENVTLLRVGAEIIGNALERQRSEEALRESEQRIRLLFDCAPVGILTSDKTGTILAVNPAILKILGSPSAEATKAINLLTFPPLVDAGVSADFRQCLDTGEITVSEHPYTTAWGKKIHLRYHLSPIKDEDGTVARVLAVVEDFTALKEAQDALRTSEELFRAIFDRSAVGIARMHLDGRIFETNLALQRFFGYSGDELRGKLVFDLSHPEDMLKDYALLKEMVDGKRDHYQIEKRFFKKNGSEVRGNLNASMMHDPTGKPEFIVAVVEDITERKNAK